MEEPNHEDDQLAVCALGRFPSLLLPLGLEGFAASYPKVMPKMLWITGNAFAKENGGMFFIVLLIIITIGW